MAHYLWDYDEKKLKKTRRGRIKILERLINYGPGEKKIKLAEVKKYWSELNLTPSAQRLFELLIWGKYQSSAKTREKFFLK